MSNGVMFGNVLGMNIVTGTVDLGSVAANTSEEESVTLTGVKTGDIVIPVKPTLEAGIGIGNCRVSAADTLQITIINATGGAVDAASETWTFLVISPESNAAASLIER